MNKTENTPKHEQAGVYDAKTYDSAKNLMIALAIGGFGLLLGLVIELI